MTASNLDIRVIVLSCRPPKLDFRLPLVMAFREAGYETCYLNNSEGRWQLTRDDSGAAKDLSWARLSALFRDLNSTGKINIIVDSANLTTPFTVLLLRLVAGRAIWCFDVHDDLKYNSTGLRRLIAVAKIFVRTTFSDVVLIAAAGMSTLFPHAVHLGNASHIAFTPRPELDFDRVLIMASIDERFDFDLLVGAAAVCQNTIFDIHGEVHRNNVLMRARLAEALNAQSNLRYLGAYSVSDIAQLVTAYDVTFVPYRTGIALTTYLDPLRFYHCLNSGMELITSDIPAVKHFGKAVHVVRGPDDIRHVLYRLRTNPDARRNTPDHYQPITWRRRAAQIVEAAQQSPKFRRLNERKSR